MITIRRANDRGRTQIGWLDSRHTFSFNRFYDPSWMGYRSLRVINDDRVHPAAGFGRHPHRDMEIISWVLSGSLAHEDSTGAKAVLNAGQIQRMSAGTGIFHSEYNASQTEPVHFLQIWIEPDKEGIPPRFEDLSFAPEESANRWRLVASPDGRDNSSVIQQSALVWIAHLDAGSPPLAYVPAQGRHLWLQIATGQVQVNGNPLEAGDGAALGDGESLWVQAQSPSAMMLFDLA
jgi:quercetin 2,3-dioxygenase